MINNMTCVISENQNHAHSGRLQQVVLHLFHETSPFLELTQHTSNTYDDDNGGIFPKATGFESFQYEQAVPLGAFGG